MESHHGRRHHLSTAPGARGRRAARLRRCARPRPLEHLLPGGARAWWAVDPQGPGTTGVARSNRRDLRRQSAEELADLNGQRCFSIYFFFLAAAGFFSTFTMILSLSFEYTP